MVIWLSAKIKSQRLNLYKCSACFKVKHDTVLTYEQLIILRTARFTVNSAHIKSCPNHAALIHIVLKG